MEVNTVKKEWVSCSIFPKGEKKLKLVIGIKITDDKYLIMGNRQYDPNWKPIPEKEGWFFKEIHPKYLSFHQFP